MLEKRGEGRGGGSSRLQSLELCDYFNVWLFFGGGSIKFLINNFFLFSDYLQKFQHYYIADHYPSTKECYYDESTQRTTIILFSDILVKAKFTNYGPFVKAKEFRNINNSNLDMKVQHIHSIK